MRSVIAGLLLVACAATPASPQLGSLQRVDVALVAPDGARHELDVYDAAEPAARRTGLMHVETLGEADGMLFRYPADSTSGYWMKNTLLPLSIAFATAAGEIVAVLDMEPCTDDPCPTYDPMTSYRFALEVPQGALDELGVEEGWRLEVPDDLPPAT